MSINYKKRVCTLSLHRSKQERRKQQKKGFPKDIHKHICLYFRILWTKIRKTMQ